MEFENIKLDSGHKVCELSTEEQARMMELYGAYQDIDFIRLQPGGWLLSRRFIKYANDIYNFKFRPNDVLIMTFPKCGTTWLQEIVWTMKNNRKLDNIQAKVPINTRCPYLELDHIIKDPLTHNTSLMESFNETCQGLDPLDGIYLQLAQHTPNPRTIKTHLPFSLLPKNILDVCKVVVMLRNPKDVCVSYHTHSTLMKTTQYCGTLDQYVDLFVQDEVRYSPFWTPIREAFERKSSTNLHICYYEDTLKNTLKEYQKLNSFLGLNLSEEEVKDIMEYTSFSAMKERGNVFSVPKTEDEVKSGNSNHILEKETGFFRKGGAGNWKNKLTYEHERKIEEWTRKNTKGTDIDLHHI